MKAMTLGQVARESWSVITRMRPAHAVVPAGAYVWAATAGGVLRVDTTTRAVTRFTHLDGLPRGAVLWAGPVECSSSHAEFGSTIREQSDARMSQRLAVGPAHAIPSATPTRA